MSITSIRSGRTELFIEGMGIATGIAFDRDGNLYVGDRSGSIFKISAEQRDFRIRHAGTQHCRISSGVRFRRSSLRNGPDDIEFRFDLSGLSERRKSSDSLPGSAGRRACIRHRGNLYAVASYRGRRGIFRFRDPKKPELVVAGLSLVGLAFDLQENLMVVDSGSLYRVRLGIMGKPYRDRLSAS